MEVMILIGVATCLSMVTILFSCIRCRRKLSEEEIQGKYFEKFRKRHMILDTFLSSRVDYVRPVPQAKPASGLNGGNGCTYEEMSSPPVPHPPVIQVQEPSPMSSSDYSFFNDSFQTVIEASSSNMSDMNKGLNSFLNVPKEHIASYISLQNHSQICMTADNALEHRSSENEGEINIAFSDCSNSSADKSKSTGSLTDSYIVPSCGPKIRIIQPSTKRKNDVQVPVLNFEADVSNELQLHVGALQRNSLSGISHFSDRDKSKSEEDVRNSDNVDARYMRLNKENLNSLEKSTDLKEKSLRKLEIEGPIYNERRLSSESTKYEMLRGSKTEPYMYKSLNKTALVLPRRPRMCSPIMTPARLTYEERSRQPTPERSQSRKTSSTSSSGYADATYDSAGSKRSDHTYDSISCELASEINFRESLSSVEKESNNRYNNYSLRNKILKTPAHRGSYTDEQNDLSAASPEHTYESIKSPISHMAKTVTACENSAVIIGRRVSNPFDSNKFSKRMINKKKQRNTNVNRNFSEKNSRRDSEDRYSPFPVTKKLAFKPAFKQVPSPKFSMIQTVSANAGSQLGNQPELCLDNLNIKTPEIKVESCQQFFDNTAFISPNVLNGNIVFEGKIRKDTIDFISPMCTYQSGKGCIHSKVSESNLKASLTEKHLYPKKSLPSLSDHLEEDIVMHCNANVYSRSTPCDLDMQNCNFF